MQFNYLPQLLMVTTFTLTGCMSSPQSPLESYLEKSSIDEKQTEQLEKLNQYLPLLERLKAQEADISQFVALTTENPDMNVVIGSLPEFSSGDSFVLSEQRNELSPAPTVQTDTPIASLEEIATPIAKISKESPKPTPTSSAAAKKKPIPIIDAPIVASAIKTLPAQIEQNSLQTQPQDTGGESQVKVALDDASPSGACTPQLVASSSDQFGVHVYSVQEKDLLMQGWVSITNDIPAFCERGAVVKQVNVAEKTFHSLRIGPYVDKAQAKLACELVRQQKKYCRVTDFSGDVL